MNMLTKIPRGGMAAAPLTMAPVLIFDVLDKLASFLTKNAYEREQTQRYIAAAALEAEKFRSDAESLQRFMADAFQERRETLALVARGLASNNEKIFGLAIQALLAILEINPLRHYAEMLLSQRNGTPSPGEKS